VNGTTVRTDRPRSRASLSSPGPETTARSVRRSPVEGGVGLPPLDEVEPVEEETRWRAPARAPRARGGRRRRGDGRRQRGRRPPLVEVSIATDRPPELHLEVEARRPGNRLAGLSSRRRRFEDGRFSTAPATRGGSGAFWASLPLEGAAQARAGPSFGFMSRSSAQRRPAARDVHQEEAGLAPDLIPEADGDPRLVHSTDDGQLVREVPAFACAASALRDVERLGAAASRPRSSRPRRRNATKTENAPLSPAPRALARGARIGTDSVRESSSSPSSSRHSKAARTTGKPRLAFGPEQVREHRSSRVPRAFFSNGGAPRADLQAPVLRLHRPRRAFCRPFPGRFDAEGVRRVRDRPRCAVAKRPAASCNPAQTRRPSSAQPARARPLRHDDHSPRRALRPGR